MRFLDNVFRETDEYKVLENAVRKGRFPCMATGLSAVHKAHLVHTMLVGSDRNALILAADEAEAQKLCSDLKYMGTSAVFYPSRDFTFREIEGVSREFEHQRIGALYGFMTGQYKVIVACSDGALQYTIPKDVLEKSSVKVKSGTEVSPERMTAALLSAGYVRVAKE